MFAISNSELNAKQPAKTNALCKNCMKKHKIKHGKNKETGEEDKLLGFINCPKSGETYLASINGKAL